MRVVLLTHGGADLVIERLVELPDIDVGAVFVESAATPKRGLSERIKRSIKYDGIHETIKKIYHASGAKSSPAQISVDLTRDAASRARIPIIEVDNFHSEDALKRMRAIDADLGVLYGTNIIKKSVFSIPKLGSINLHQGLAPYYRGGPPVFWELFNAEDEVGLTVHFVEPKVDTGDIVRQKKIPLKYDPKYGLDYERFINDFRSGLRADSARLVADAVAAIASGKFTRVVQDTSLGTRYRLPTKKQKDEMRRRLEKRFSGGANG